MTKKIDSLINQQLSALLQQEKNTIGNLANASALLFGALEDVNWCGFYLYNKVHDELVLGPFQGKVACMHIKNGNGVCGTAFKANKVLNVTDVHEFPGHIACDSASNSELVIPISKNDQPFGVLDIDSPILNRFGKDDEETLTKFVNVLTQFIDIKLLNALN